MRLSGNYFDRLLFNVLPWTIFGVLIVYLTKNNSETSILIYLLIILTIALWAIDSLIIYTKFKHPKLLRIDNGSLVLNNERINSTDIDKLTPVTDNRMKWSFKMIELKLKDGRVFILIDKPQTFVADLMNKKSKTITKLIEQYPDLSTKLATRKII